MEKIDVLILGAGAAGLMCAIEAGKRNRKVLVLDHANKAGKKILMSGGGRCNFTNYHIDPANYISYNKHFCKSALTRYTQWDFIELVKKHHIPFHEKTLGQLFCDNKSKDILNLLLAECMQNTVEIRLNTIINQLEKIHDHHFKVKTTRGDFHAEALVIASGGLSIPTMGASPFGYKVAEQFGIKVWPTRAGLVPFTLQPEDKNRLGTLSGIAIDSIVANKHKKFHENFLFTHRGLSGPAILQISSYWQAGEEIIINLLPTINLFEYLKKVKIQHPHKIIHSILNELLPKRVIETLLPEQITYKKLSDTSYDDFKKIAEKMQNFTIKPNGTEGYRTAEVTIGGVDCAAISSKTMEVLAVPGLYFIGEVLDVTGWLGGFNFQWAWSSGWAAGQFV